MAGDVDRMRALKRGGIFAFPESVAIPLEQLVASLKEAGIFLVPVGELEEWLAAENIQESKTHKVGLGERSSASYPVQGCR